jgi:para-aminobenzoate synthetase/4-amino-4-deoxychorismate lyase
MRNDLGRVCDYGSIQAEPPRVEAHAGVWHLVSTVSGRLREGVGDGTLLRATFPPGSVTGAPKVQAMKVIAALESTRRELYTGAVGIVSPVAGLDLSVAIRTFETGPGQIWFGAGGGIVADSDPEAELAEALDKAAGPVAAIGGGVDRPHPLHRSRVLPPAALDFGPRPDPARGVFETILVEGGRPAALEAHLARLAGSLGVLYGTQLDLDAAKDAMQAATVAGPGRHRLRVDADPSGSMSFTLTRAAPPLTEPATLRPFRLPGGLGPHKLRDRALLEALSAQGGVPLLVDGDGMVLEAAYANVWIVEDGSLLTPPADGRVLPGVTRAALLAGDPTAREEPITLERLRAVRAVFLTSSIAGRHAARCDLGPDRAAG